VREFARKSMVIRQAAGFWAISGACYESPAPLGLMNDWIGVGRVSHNNMDSCRNKLEIHFPRVSI